MGRGRPNDRIYIGCVTFAAAILGLIVTFCVLQVATSSSSSNDLTETYAFGEGNLASTSDGTKLTKGNANILLIVLDDAGWSDFSYHSTDP